MFYGQHCRNNTRNIERDAAHEWHQTAGARAENKKQLYCFYSWAKEAEGHEVEYLR